ncbi:MAG TPA: putative metal-dependent hydrolase [Gemmatimonadales bacterium]
MDDLRYPIGPFRRPQALDPAARAGAIAVIARTPADFRQALSNLDDRQLDTPYRPGGWTVRQVAHHVPDSHMNAYMRFKLALTEAVPTIKPYEESRWAELPDSSLPIDTSLRLLEALHQRWVVLLQALTEEQWDLEFIHPESGRQRLYQLLALYAWHGPHHTAHVTRLRERMGWNPNS